MSTKKFRDQKFHLITQEDFDKRSKYDHWRCYFCGKHFQVNDIARWMQLNVSWNGEALGNIWICKKDNYGDVAERALKHWQEAKTKYWYFYLNG